MTNDNYNALSSYLNNKIDNQIIEEGLLDIGGSTGKKLLGWLGGFFVNFTSVKERSDNKLISTYLDLSKREFEKEKERLQNEQKAEEDLDIEKLKAEFEHNQNQLDIASKNRVKAYKARAKQIKDYTTRISKNKLLYSKEENEAIINKIREAGNELGSMDPNPLTEMMDLAMIIGTNENGEVRTFDEIKSEIENNPDSELAKSVKAYNDLAKKHGKSIISSMTSDEFKTEFTNKCADVRKISELDDRLKDAQEKQDEFDKKSNAVSKINELKKEHNDAETAHNEANEKLKKLTNNKDNPFIPKDGYDSNTGKITSDLSEAEFNSAIKSIMTKHRNGDNPDVDKFKKELQDSGVPEDYINALTDDTVFKFDSDEALERVESDECKKLVKDAIKSVTEKQEANIQEAHTAVKQSKEALNKTIDVDKATIEDIKKHIEEHKPTDKDMSDAITEYENMSDEDKESGIYDITSDVGKKAKKDVEDAVKKSQKDIDTNKKNIEANKKANADARSKITNRNANKVDDDIKDDVEKLIDGLEGGETRKGKDIGFGSGDNFVPKPKPGASEEEQNEYIKKRKEYMLTIDVDSIGTKDNDVKSVTKNDDGTFTITYNNGKTEKTDDKETAAMAKAEVISNDRSKAAIIDTKQKAAETIKKCIKDGKLDADAVKEFIDSDNEEDKEAMETLNYLLNHEKNIDAFFKGVDLTGNATADEISKAIGDSKEELKKHFEDFEDTEFKKRDKSTDDTEDSDYEDVEDDDEDANDDNEYDSDEDETDADGNKTGNKKKLKNPAKIWHRKKRKNGKGMTKSYYNGDDSISADDYKKRMENYKKAKKKANNTSEGISNKLHCNSIGKYIVESDNVFNSEYNKLRAYIINNIDK